MQTRKIGTLDVSIVGLGCNNFGGRCDVARTRAVVDAAIDVGVTFLDTADIYGGTRSEEFLGEVLAGRREKVLIATKFGIRIDDDRPGGGSPAYIRRAAEDSLRRLKTDRIDLYQIHRPDPDVPIAETLGALHTLVAEGKVREIGCSNFSVAQLREAEAAAATLHGPRFESVQNDYSLLQRAPEEDGVLDECGRTGVGLLPYFPLASGLLTGKYRKGRPHPDGTRIAADSKALAQMERVEALALLAEAQGRTLLEMAMGYLLAQPAVASVIAGATKAEQVKANAASAAHVLTADEVAAVRAALA